MTLQKYSLRSEAFTLVQLCQLTRYSRLLIAEAYCQEKVSLLAGSRTIFANIYLIKKSYFKII